jgi:hypothetical protein
MEYQYFTQITNSIVTDIRKTTKQFMEENPNLYTGFWVEVSENDPYPAIGWGWDKDKGFSPPIEVGTET